jgi:hypothetical protein
LRHEDVEALVIEPLDHPTRKQVQEQLEKASRRTGKPRAIVSDRGTDVKTGVEDYCGAHPGTAPLYDIAHKGACLLEHRLERDPRWPAFVKRMGQAKFQSQQTELAYLVGPSLRPKARYMNLGPVLNWARQTLQLLETVPAEGEEGRRREAKFGWLRDYREAIAQWLPQYELVQRTVGLVRRQGLYVGAAEQVATNLKDLVTDEPTRQLAEELVAFVAEQSRQCRPGEQLPGSTEVLESCLGKWKEFERQQSKQGFTGSVLALAAMLSRWPEERVLEALNRVPLRKVLDWSREHLGPSVQAQRRLAYTQCKQNSDEAM